MSTEGPRFAASLVSVVSTGKEPGGGVTLVVDAAEVLGSMGIKARYLCIEVPYERLQSLGEALIAASHEARVNASGPRGVG